MPEAATLSASALARLVDLFFYPDPDSAVQYKGPWGPLGPGGPVMRHSQYWAMLNPQPLPPDPPPELFAARAFSRKEGPLPDPWRFVALARATIQHLVALHESASMLGGGGAESATKAISERMMEIAEWYCGNEPRHIHIPFHWPWPPGPPPEEDVKIRPEELLIMGVQFHHAAEMLADSPLRDPLNAAGARMIETATRGMEGAR